jgi:organic radical activating enzyme
MNRGKKEGETLHGYKARIIDPISKSYCAAKWYNATIWLGHGQTTSCHHPPGHWIPLEELKDNPSAIHNTPHKKKMRKMMLEGERPAECEYCWKVEDMGKNHISDRVFKTEIFTDKDIEKTTTMPWEENVNLKTLEISFDRACNFKCSYCNPAFSTAWVKDINDYGGYQNIQSDGRGHFQDTAPYAEPATKKQEDNPYIQAFHKWWESDLADSLEEIRITGGEPIMHKGTWKLFQWFKDNPDRGRNMRFAINSNMCPDTPKVLDRLVKESWHVPHLEVYTSMEAVGIQGEYIRDGLDYDLWMSNIHRVLNESNVKKLHMMMTINSLCLVSITEFMDQMLDLREQYENKAPTMTLNILRFPSFQSAAILPEDIKTFYKEKLDNWYNSERPQKMLSDAEKESVRRLVDYLDIVKTPHKNTAETPKLYNDFKSFFAQYDIRRKKDFMSTFPGPLAEWFDSLEAEVPSSHQILHGVNSVNTINQIIDDPATIKEYDGGDDEHEKDSQPGWNTKTDELGG